MASMIAGLAVLGSTAGLAPLQAAQARGTLVVRNDAGGQLQQRLTQIQQLRAQGVSVRIEAGYCNSACTLYLGLSRTCVSPQARLGFHGPQSQFYGVPLPPAEFERWSQIMAAHYPGQLRRWYLAQARHTTVGLHVVSGRELIQMGVRRC